MLSPRIAIDGDGDVVAVWLKRSTLGTNYVVRSASKPDGGEWGPQVDLTTAAKFTGELGLAINADGDAVAVWRRYNGANYIVQSASRPAGGAWSAPVDLSAAGRDASEPAVTIDGDGDAVAVWSRYDGSNYVVQSADRPAGGEWGSAVDLTAGSKGVSTVRVASDDEGDAAAAWESYDGSNFVVQSASRPAGGGWGAPADLTAPAEGVSHIGLAMNADGDAVMSWNQFDGSNQIVQSVSRPAGGTWGAPVDLSAAGGNAENTDIAFDAAGDAVAVWRRYNGSNYIVQSASRPAGGDWSSPVDISVTGETATKLHLAVSAGGDAVAVWEVGTYTIRSAVKPAGGAWGSPVKLSVAGQAAFDPRVAVNAAGDAVVVWSTGFEVIQAVELPGSPLLVVTKVGTGSGTVSSSPAGIDCGGICEASFAKGTLVSLSGVPAAGSKAVVWLTCPGSVNEADECVVTMGGARSVIASFELAESPSHHHRHHRHHLRHHHRHRHR